MTYLLVVTQVRQLEQADRAVRPARHPARLLQQEDLSGGFGKLRVAYRILQIAKNNFQKLLLHVRT